MNSVTFNCGGEKLVVNPSHVAAIQPHESSPGKTLLTVLGHVYKVRGEPTLVKAALGWEDGPVVGFDTPESQEWEKMLLRAGHSKDSPADTGDAPRTTEKITGRQAMGEPATIEAGAGAGAAASSADDGGLPDLGPG